MAFSKCPKCENSYFEVKENSPRSSNYKLLFVQCTSCGTVVGTMDYYNIGTIVKGLEKKIESGGSMSNIDGNLNIINQNILKLFNQLKDIDGRLFRIENKSKL